MAKAAPKGLSAAGRRLWRDITREYELRVDELRILGDACREADIIDTLEEGLVGAPLTVNGSMGQPVANPLLAEVRQHRNVLKGLLGSLKLTDAAAGGTEAPRSVSAREAAMQRWGRRTA